MSRILVYTDARQTGGHEIMACEAIRCLAGRHEVYAVISQYNADLRERIKKIGGIHITLIKYYSNRFQIARNFLSIVIKARLKKICRTINPDLCIAVQGTIDSSFLALPVCKKIGVKTISYIPLAMELKRVSKHKIIGFLKDMLQTYYYRFPWAFITINEFLAEAIMKRSGNPRVVIVRNGIDFAKYERYDKTQCRAKYAVPNDKYVLGYVGRIEYWHKGLDYYFDFLENYAANYPEIVFLFVGSGNKKAEARLAKLASTIPNIMYLPWTDVVSEVYSLMDCFILPSRFESGPGCPLTLVEALFFGLPVIASAIPEIMAFLPRENLFEIKNYRQMNEKIGMALRGALARVAFNQDDYSIERFRANFSDCIGNM